MKKEMRARRHVPLRRIYLLPFQSGGRERESFMASYDEQRNQKCQLIELLRQLTGRHFYDVTELMIYSMRPESHRNRVCKKLDER